jgi:hypothetical protein
LTEAGLSAARAPDPTAALDVARALVNQLIDGLRKKA